MSGFLDETAWSDRVFTGRWTEARGGGIDDLEPATGDVLTRVGKASSEDVAASCAVAAEAQPDWAARRHDERAQIMLDAARHVRDNYSELTAWIMRESGGIRVKAETELEDAIQRLHHAAALTGESYGEMIPTAIPGRWSFAHRVPLGVVGVISPFNYPSSCPFARSRPRSRSGTRSCSSRTRARPSRVASSSRACWRKPGCPRASCMSCRRRRGLGARRRAE